MIFTLLLFWRLGTIPLIIEENGLGRKIPLILFTSLGACLVGLWDDVRHLRPLYKLLGQMAFACFFAVFGFRFDLLHIPGSGPINLGLAAVPLTVFWILSIINAVNMIDGVDGLASMVTAGSLLLIGAASAMLANGGILVLSLVALGAVLGFQRYNWSPARIYLGDAGSNGLGMLLACSLVALGQSTCWFPGSPAPPERLVEPFPYQLFVVTLLVAYPALEILLSVTRRFLKGKPLSRADKGHLHHRFLNRGWSKQGVCWTALVITLFLGSVPLAVLTHEYGKATWLMAASGLILGLVLSLLGFLNFLLPHVVSHIRPHFLIANHFIQMQRLKLGMAQNREEIITLLHITCSEFGVRGFQITVKANGQGNNPCHYAWERPIEASRLYLEHIKTDIEKGHFDHFKDKLSLEGGNCEAYWIFEPHSEESELDVEYRVLVSEFMREVLGRLYILKSVKGEETLVKLDNQTQAKIRSSLLRRKHLEDQTIDRSI
jgi:UDP-GlcNAc:undecaprenyl-phosphate GlcNAc-1-phosphate transferase